MAQRKKRHDIFSDEKYPIFTDGYYARLIEKGERPAVGSYPANHLPKAAIKEMATRTGYVASWLKEHKQK